MTMALLAEPTTTAPVVGGLVTGKPMVLKDCQRALTAKLPLPKAAIKPPETPSNAEKPGVTNWTPGEGDVF
jgi:hypothetical protein